MAESADARDLKSLGALLHMGSNPISRTILCFMLFLLYYNQQGEANCSLWRKMNMEKYQKSEELPPGLKYIPLTPRDVAIEHEIKLTQEVLRYPLSPKTRMSWERWL